MCGTVCGIVIIHGLGDLGSPRQILSLSICKMGKRPCIEIFLRIKQSMIFAMPDT